MSFFQQFPKIQYDFADNGIDTRIVDLFRFVKADEKYFDDVSTYQYFQIRNGDRPDIVSNLLYNTPDYYWTFFLVNDHLKSGLSGWPMMQEELDDYLETEYNGTVIQTRPILVRNGDGIVTEYRNSLAGIFEIGETVYGSESGAYGRLDSKDTQLSQLVLKDVVGTFQEQEFITGSTTEDSVASYEVYPYAEAPHHYESADGTIFYNALSIGELNVQPGTSDSELIAVSNREYEIALNDERANIRIIRPDSIYKFVQIYQGLING
jgi:hypothetical protein